MVTLVNRAKVATSTTGTGAVSLGAAEDGYQTFSDAGVVNSDVVRYTIEDGDAWEIGSGTYSSGTLTRVLDESSTGSLLNLSGDAVVYVTAAGEDIQQPPSEGPFVDGDKTKLDGIEAGATADQTAGEIKTAYESNANTNAYTDAEKSKLAGIASGAEVNTVDSVNTQTGAVVLDADDISDAATTNKFTTAAEISKLAGIEAGANVTDTANVTAAGALMDSEVTNLAQVKAFDSSDYATAAQGALADSATQPGDNISTLTNDAGFTTNVGDITGVTAGSGITGGGTSGTVTISHADTSSQASVNNSGTTVIQDITLDTYGHITALGSTTLSIPAAYTNSDVDTHLNYSTATTGQVLSYSGSDYDWVDVSAVANGNGGDEIFWENDQSVTTDYTITNGKNAMSAGPITINSGVTVTVGAGETWTVV